MHIAVRVCSRDPRQGEYEQTTSCLMVYVAIDAEGRPTSVPKWEPDTEEDRALQAHAMHLMELGRDIQAELQAFGQAPANSVP